MSYKSHNRPTRIGQPDAAREIAAADRARERCANGDHEPRIVPADRVVYGFGGRRRRVGDRYCAACGAALDKETNDG